MSVALIVRALAFGKSVMARLDFGSIFWKSCPRRSCLISYVEVIGYYRKAIFKGCHGGIHQMCYRIFS